MANPTITGTHPTYTTDGASVMPFTGVTVTDSVDGAIDTLKLAYFGAGQISGVAYSGSTISDSNGGYRIIGTAAQVTAALDAIKFTPPPPQPGRTTVDVVSFYVQSSSNGYASDSSSIVSDTTAPDTVAISPQVTYNNGVATLTGTVTTALGVTGVDIQAIVDGVPTDLGTAALDANGNFTFADRIGPHTQSFITAITQNDNSTDYSSARTVASFSLTGGLRQGAFRAEQDNYTADGSAEIATTLFRAGGARQVDVQASGQTFESDRFDTFANNGAPDNAFVFNPGFGRDVVSLFRVDGADHDTLSFKGSDFGNSIAEVLQSTRFEKGGAVITDPTSGYSVKLLGVSKAQIAQNQADIAFHA